MSALAVVFISAGLFFLAVTTLGMMRFPDFFSRTHVVAKSETLGTMLVIVGLMFEYRLGDGTYKLVLLVAFAMVANSTAMHGLARAVHRQRDTDHLDGDGTADQHVRADHHDGEDAP